MKTIAEIKKAYFELLDNSWEMDSFERLHKGYAWMAENGFEPEVINYCNENDLESICEILTRKYHNNPIKDKKMARLQAEYCETAGVRYNQRTRRYEND